MPQYLLNDLNLQNKIGFINGLTPLWHYIMPYKLQKNKKLALELGLQTYQILTNDDEVCITSLSTILLAVLMN